MQSKKNSSEFSIKVLFLEMVTRGRGFPSEFHFFFGEHFTWYKMRGGFAKASDVLCDRYYRVYGNRGLGPQ
jgi:hypothetical protein